MLGSFEAQAGDVVVLGLPTDRGSSFLKGTAKAPPAIRRAFLSDSTNRCLEDGRDLEEEPRFRDAGDLPLSGGEAERAEIEDQIRAYLHRGARIVSLGGDHAVTYPILRAYSSHHPNLQVLHFDAHPDLYDELDGDRYSHACPFARVLEERLITRLVQIGIRTATPHQREQAQRYGVEMHEMRDWDASWEPAFDGPLYVSIDLDALDPAFAPGVSHHEPGGLSTREVLRVLHRLRGPIVGADVVELNPDRDWHGMTAALAAKLVKELAGKMLG